MSSPLSDLETRRKILFMDGSVTIRNLASDSVLVTFGTAIITRSQIQNIKSFLGCYFQTREMNTMIVDLSNANYTNLQHMLALAKLPVHECKGLAFLISNHVLKITMHLLTLRMQSSKHIKIFKTFNLAASWSRTLK
jgi:hypothetical protein